MMSSSLKKILADEVLSCVESPASFTKKYQFLIQELDKGDKEYHEYFFEAIYNILSSSTQNPTKVFFGAYLIAKVSERGNSFTIDRLARNKSLLNKIFQDAQYGRHDSLDKRGKNYFNKSPGDEVANIGRNYIRLVLEILVYWRRRFTEEEKKSARYIFQVMYSSLTNKVIFPELLYFIESKRQITDNYHVTPYNEDFAEPKEEEKSNGSPGTMSSYENSQPETQDPATLVKNCIKSSEQFQQYCKVILEGVQKDSKEYNNTIITTLARILNDEKNYKPQEKIYAVYLVLRITETKNIIFAKCLAKSQPLLDTIFKEAQFNHQKPLEDRGKTFFSKSPTLDEQIMGQNYLNLVLECLDFWNKSFGNTENKKTSLAIFGTMSKALQTKVHFPTEYFYVGKHFEDPSEENSESFELLLSSNTIQNTVSHKTPEIVSDIKYEIKLLRDTKEQIWSFFINNPNNTNGLDELLKFLLDETKRYSNNLRHRGEWLMSSSQAISGGFLDYAESIYSECEHVDLIKKELSDFFNRVSNYDTVKKNLLELLKEIRQPSFISPKKEKKAQGDKGARVKPKIEKPPLEEKTSTLNTNKKNQNKAEDPEDKISCIICFNNQRQVVYDPCKHLCTCEACAKQLQKQKKSECPVCRAKITGYTRVFIA